MVSPVGGPVSDIGVAGGFSMGGVPGAPGNFDGAGDSEGAAASLRALMAQLGLAPSAKPTHFEPGSTNLDITDRVAQTKAADAARSAQALANAKSLRSAATAGPIGVTQGKAQLEALTRERGFFEDLGFSFRNGVPMQPANEQALLAGMFMPAIPGATELAEFSQAVQREFDGTATGVSRAKSLASSFLPGVSVETAFSVLGIEDDGTTTSGTTAVASTTTTGTGSQFGVAQQNTNDASPSPSSGSGQIDGGFDPIPNEGSSGAPPVVVPDSSGSEEDESLPGDNVGDAVDPVADAQANADQVQEDFDAEIPEDVQAASAAADEIRRKRKRVNRRNTIQSGPLGILTPPQFLGKKRALGG